MEIESAREAAKDWVGKRVLDERGEEIGAVDGVWLDPSTYRVEFVGVQTGWVFGKTHVVPAKDLEMAVEDDAALRLRCASSLVKAAPTFEPGYELAEVDKERITQHYGVAVPAERVTDINEVRPGEGLNPEKPAPQEPLPSLAVTPDPLPESEHTAAEHAYPTSHPLDNLLNQAHGS